MTEAMLLFRHLYNQDYTIRNSPTGRPKLAEEVAIPASETRSLKIRLKLPSKIKLADISSSKKNRYLNCKIIDSTEGIGKGKAVESKETATNCGSLCRRLAAPIRIPNSGSGTGKENAKATVGGKTKVAVPVVTSSSLEKSKIASSKERMEEGKYQEKFEATKRKFVEFSKGIIEKRKKIKRIEFRDVPEQSRLAVTGTKKLIKPSRCRVNFGFHK